MTGGAALLDRAEDFAADLNELFEAAIFSPPVFVVAMAPDGLSAAVGPASKHGPDELPFARVPLQRQCDAGEPRLSLRAEFRTSMDREDEYLQVDSSAFGLWVQMRKSDKQVPVFRVEYDRNKAPKPPAHIQFHVESAPLAWIYGSAGRPLPRFEEVHFPLGGHRFRPTIEQMLEFLDVEELYTEWKPGWAAVRIAKHEEYEKRQARATARRFQNETADALSRLGWTVEPPGPRRVR